MRKLNSPASRRYTPSSASYETNFELSNENDAE
jgi:hypothetical protein